jgi:lysophospholipase L1-like esterase
VTTNVFFIRALLAGGFGLAVGMAACTTDAGRGTPMGAAGRPGGGAGKGGSAGSGGSGGGGAGSAGGAAAPRDAAAPDVADGRSPDGGSPGDASRADDARADVAASRSDASDAPVDAASGVAAVRFVGRIDRSDAKGPRFAWSGSGLIAAFSGTTVGVKLGGGQQYTVVLDGVVRPKLVPTSTALTPIAAALPAGAHVVELYRRSEAEWGESQFLGFDFGAGKLLPPPPAPDRRIEVIGDSISTGFGDEGVAPCPYVIDTENHYLTYEAIASRNVGAELITTAWQGKGLVCNVGDNLPCANPFPIYYDRTLPARVDSAWDFASWQPHVVVINLGTNDFSTAIDPTAAEFATGYVNFLRHLRGKYPGALILCTCGPMLPLGELQKVRAGIDTAVATLADTRIKAFDLPIQSGPTGCAGHPSLATHRAMAEVLTAELKAELDW